MRIISKTGFKSITHGILFDPQKEKKGKDLSSDGHVLEVTEYEEEGVEHYIEAQIVRSTSVTEQRYLTVLHLNHERHVVNTTCTCQANKSEKCKHVFALIHNVNNHDSLTKTDFSQQWGKPSAASFAKEKYSKGRFFYQMFPPSPPTDVESYAVSPDDLKEPSALKLMLLESRKDKMDQEIEYLVNSLFKRMEIKINAMNCEGCLNHMFILNKEYLIYEQKVVLSAELQEFYNSHIVLSQKNIIKLCCDTVDQSNCQEWHDVRLMRLSASKKIHSIKRRIKKTVESIAYDMLHQKKVDTKDTRYGLKHEKAAKEEYMKLFSCEVLDVGVIISDNQNWLCASLDGVVIEDNSIKKLLEIKCPPICENQPVVNFKNKTCVVSYLQFQNNSFILKKSDVFYTQCQTQMYVTGVSACDLFIYSKVKEGSYCVTVYRDEEFLKPVILECHRFYFNDFLPQLYNFMKAKNTDDSSNDINRSFDGTDISNLL